MLAKTTVPINLGKGIDTKTDPKQVQGKLLILQNGIFQTGLEIRKRNGYIPLPSLGKGVMISPYNNELVTLDGTNLYSYSASGSNQITKGALPTVSLSVESVIRNTNQQTNQDSANNGSIQCFVWTDSGGGCRYTIFDTATGQSIVNNASISATALYSKVLAIGTKFIIVYYDSGAIKYRAIDITTPTVIGAATNIATDPSTTTISWDATVINNKVYLVYNNTLAKISFYTLTSALVLSARTDFGTDHANVLTIFTDASFNAWVSYAINGSSGVDTKINAFILNQALTVTVLGKTQLDSFQIAGTGPAINTMNGAVTGTTGTVYYEVVQAALVTGEPLNFIKSNTVTTAGVVGVAGTFNRGVGLASKIVTFGGFYFFLVSYQSNLQSSYFLIRSDGVIVGKLAPSAGGGLAIRPILPELNTLSAGVFQTASLVKDSIIVQNGVITAQTGVQSATFTFTSVAPSKFVLGENLQVAGALLQMYDGNNVVEHGFNVFPEGLKATTTADPGTLGVLGTGSLGVGTDISSPNPSYQYSGVYQWTDNQGQIHRSAPSVPITLPFNTNTVILKTTGTFTHLSNNITNIADTSKLSIGQYVSVTNSVIGIENRTITAVGATSVTFSGGAYGPVGSANNQPIIFTNNPINWIIGIITAGSAVLVANSGNFAGWKAGQKVISGDDSAGIFPDGSYVVSAVTTGVGDINLTLNLPATFEPSNGVGFFYTIDTISTSVSFPTLRLTQKLKVSLALYRTASDGVLFYLVTDPVNLTYNDKTVDYVSISDIIGDSILIGNQELYTTGGEVENIAAPAFNITTTFKSRGIGVPSENQLSWWYSKQVIPGSPVEWSDVFFENIDARIGSIQSAGVLDDKLVFGGPTSLFYVVGSGPSPSGANNDFSDAQLISSDVGCQNQASMILMPFGLMFQSQKGIYLLDRSLGVEYVGADVEAFNAIPVTSAQLMDTVNQVRFTLSDGTELVYDYFYKQWDVFTNISANDTCLFQDQQTIIKPSGVIWKETPGTFTDDGAAILLDMTTNWMSFANIQGFQRVYSFLVLGEWKSPHVLTFQIYKDFDDTAPVQTVTIPFLSSIVPYQFRVFMNEFAAKCESMKIRITESQPGALGEGLSLSNFAFVVGVKKGLDKVTAARSFG